MAFYRVVETQTVKYSWIVDSGTEQEAEGTAMDGVPTGATERLIASDVTVEEADAGAVPLIVLGHRFAVAYRITTGIDDGSTIAEGSVVVRAQDRKAARQAARLHIEDNDAHYDARIQPSIKIDSIDRLDS